MEPVLLGLQRFSRADRLNCSILSLSSLADGVNFACRGEEGEEGEKTQEREKGGPNGPDGVPGVAISHRVCRGRFVERTMHFRRSATQLDTVDLQ